VRKPTTPPVRNAIRIAFSRPPSCSRAAAATRRLARVAIAMPAAPMNAEKTAPTTKNTDRPTCTAVPPSFTGSRNSRTTAITTNTASVLNWRYRYAVAPSCTAPAISCIFSVPRPAVSTDLTRAAAKPNATSAITAATTT
jgi:hypothetical protein